MGQDIYDNWGRGGEAGAEERTRAGAGPLLDVTQYLESGRSQSGKPLPSLPLLTIDRAERQPVLPGSDRAVAPPEPAPKPEREFEKGGTRKLPDGATLSTDSHGRVIATVSADGSKMREVFYENPRNNEQVSRVTIDRQNTFVRRGDGTTWDVYKNGQFAGNWFGEIAMSRQGQYSFTDYTAGVTRKFGPDTKEIRAEDASARRVGGSEVYYPEYKEGVESGDAAGSGCWQGGCGWSQGGGCPSRRAQYSAGCHGRGFPILRRIFGR